MSQPDTTADDGDDVRLDALGLPVRAMNCLHNDNITTTSQVRELGYEGLLRLPNMRKRHAQLVWDAVSRKGGTDPYDRLLLDLLDTLTRLLEDQDQDAARERLAMARRRWRDSMGDGRIGN